MSVKSVFLGSLVVTLLSLGGVHGQGTMSPYGGQGAMPPATSMAPPSPAPPPGPGVTNAGPRDPAAPSSLGLSSWITYPRPPGCCGPVGGNGPIGSELYFRSGMTFPFGPGLLGNSLNPGWAFEAGGRVLFFNPQVDAAWTVDLGLSNFHNFGDHKRTATLLNLVVPASNISPGGIVPMLEVTPNSFNRTFANLAFGREWYLAGTADSRVNQSNWRVGWDVGGRWGSGKLELDEIRHRVDVIGGVFVSVHSDIEVPCGNVMFYGGVRGEWSYTWSDILQPDR